MSDTSAIRQSEPAGTPGAGFSAVQSIGSGVAPPVQSEPLPLGYTISDSTEWGNAVEEGLRALLHYRGRVVDTVDLVFGVATVGQDSLVFLPVRTDTVPLFSGPPAVFEHIPAEFVLWTPIRRRELREWLPYFHSYFSSPRKADSSALYYWGIAPRPSTSGLYAMRYDFRSRHVDSLFLQEDGLNTDYRYYLPVPQVSGSEVRFGEFVLDSQTWRVLQRPLAN